MTAPCSNCGQTPAGPFCQFCGQRVERAPFTVRALVEQVPKTAFDVDRGLWHTITGLLLRPGEVINGYLDGQRIQYTNPLTLTLLFGGLTALLYSSGLIDFSRIGDPPPDLQDRLVETIGLVFRYYSLMLLLFVPLAAWASRRCFVAFQRNYAEHLIINIYIAAMQAVYSVAMFPVLVSINESRWFPVVWNLSFPIGLAYNIFVLVKVFSRPAAQFKAALRASLAVALFFLVGGFLLFVGGVGYAVFMVLSKNSPVAP